MLFAWVGSPDSPITSKDIYGSTTLDPGQRTKLVNDAELTYIVKDIPRSRWSPGRSS